MRTKIYIIINTLLIIIFISCNKAEKKPRIDKGFKYFYIDVKGFDLEIAKCLKDNFLNKKVSCNDIFCNSEYSNMVWFLSDPLDSIKFLDAKTLPESNFIDNLYKIEIVSNKSEDRHTVAIFISEGAGNWRRIRFSCFPIDYSDDMLNICNQIEYYTISHMTI